MAIGHVCAYASVALASPRRPAAADDDEGGEDGVS
jgi:hypothetical protein